MIAQAERDGELSGSNLEALGLIQEYSAEIETKLKTLLEKHKGTRQ